MADNPVAIPDAPAPPPSVERKMLEVKIQELKSRKVRHQQDIEDLIEAQKKKLEARIEMIDLAITGLEAKRDAIEI